ncbi:MAG: hypothetical protein P8X57_07205 [Cyclobacteriaceae bacterium]
MKRSLYLVLLLIFPLFKTYSQDCKPCVSITKLQIISPTNELDTIAQLNAGTRIGLNIQIDDAVILDIAEDYTRLLDFSDDKRTNLLRKGQVIEKYFEEYVFSKNERGEIVNMVSTGFDFASGSVSEDGHSFAIDIATLAKPASGAKSILLEGQVGLYIDEDATEEVPVRNVSLKKETPTSVQVRDRKITFTYVRSVTRGPITSHIFQYESDLPVLEITESASRTPSEQIAVQQIEVSGLDNIELMVEIPKVGIREIPFTVEFGLGL